MENNRQNRFASISLIIAFALLAAVFAGMTICCKHLLVQYIESENIRTAVSLAAAAALTLAALYALRAINNRLTKDE